MRSLTRDLALYLGHSLHPHELSDQAKADLDAARNHLVTLHPVKLLDGLLQFHKSGLHPIGPTIERVNTEVSTRKPGQPAPAPGSRARLPWPAAKNKAKT